MKQIAAGMTRPVLPLPTGQSPRRGSGMQAASVLVLEDDAIVRDGLVMVLQDWGLTVASAGTLAEARTVLGGIEAGPDLIIADYHLSDGTTGLDGLDSLAAAAGGTAACLVITGSTDADALRRIAASGVQQLHKPVSPKALQAALRDLLDRG